MITPLLVSKIVFALGVTICIAIIWRKFNAVRAVPQTAEQESFTDFISHRLEAVFHHLSDGYHIASRALLRVAFASLHGMKLVSLKLETRTTKWISRVQKASQKVKEEKAKKMELEEMSMPEVGIKTENTQGSKGFKSEEFFSILKDTPKHDKLKNKLSLIKKETREGEQKME